MHFLSFIFQTYQQRSDDFPQLKSAELDIMFGRTEDHLQHAVTMLQIEAPIDQDILSEFKKIQDNYKNYLQEVKEMCQQIWAKFDMTCIILGLLTMMFATCLGIYVIINIGSDNATTACIVAFVSTLWLVFFFVFLYSVDLKLRGLIIALIVGLSIMFVSLVIFINLKNPTNVSLLKTDKEVNNKISASRRYMLSLRPLDLIALVLMTLNLVGMFSNSYVVYEDHVVTFLLNTTVLLLAMSNVYTICLKSHVTNTVISSRKLADGTSNVRHKSRSQTHSFDLGYLCTSPQTLTCGLYLLFALCVRASVHLRACREEQWQCVDSPFLRSISALNTGGGQPQNMRYVFSVACLVVIVLATRYYLRYRGNLNGTSAAVLVASYTPSLSAVSIGLYWALQALPQKIYDSLPTWQIVMLPQLVYLLVFVSFIVVIIQPLCIFVVMRNKENPATAGFIHGGDSSQIIPRLCNHIKSHWKGSFPSSNGNYRYSLIILNN